MGINVTLKKKGKIMQCPNSYTKYLTISSDITRDSQYTFEKYEEVEIIVDPKQRRIMIVSVKNASMKVSSESKSN